MNEPNPFRKFSFSPRLLVGERKKVEEKYENIDRELLVKLGRKKLPDLLAQIRKLPLDEAELTNFAAMLKKREVRLLVYDYPYKNETTDTIKKITTILIKGYQRDIGKQMWYIFQYYFEDHHIHRVLSHALQLEEEPSFLKLDNTIRKQLREVFKDTDSILMKMTEKINQSDYPIEHTLRSWCIKEKSDLYYYLLKNKLVSGLADPVFISLEGVDVITNYLDIWTTKNYKSLLSIYISHRRYDEMDDEIMLQALRKISNPNEDERPWGFFDQSDIDKVKKWLMLNELKDFFDEDMKYMRFEYWKKYMSSVKNVYVIHKPTVIALDFGNFVVVEFGKGGAAYFYYRDGFLDILLPRRNNKQFQRTRNRDRKESFFKEKDHYEYQGVPLYINRLIHRGNWEFKFDRYMREFLSGNISYQE
ncbi:hypothetical protein [Texcoconibacillus texcoconensis]|uniref:Zorya protein ZorC EH domain-containing protein n=1 Tax=Texcoconibacillus texcoconensis TaxID=1095777 RepID=A0A840QPW0_9BACI|nr:hypothetical protein [Texcoconibacillus texcoconensis]MBB5173371.1 hypothetical protein [Texcoconibacillus texcoconensis]